MASSRFLRGMTRAGVSSTGAAACRSRASISPRVAGASPRNRPRSIPLGTTRISPAGMPMAVASSVRLASEIGNRDRPRPRFPEQVPRAPRVKTGAVAVGRGRHVVVPGHQSPDGAVLDEAAKRGRERDVDVEAAHVVGNDHVQARRRLAQVPGEGVHEAVVPGRDRSRIERPLDAPDRGVSPVRQRDPNQRDPGIRQAAASRDHADRVSGVRHQPGVVAEHGLHAADHGRRGEVQQPDRETHQLPIGTSVSPGGRRRSSRAAGPPGAAAAP